MTRVRRWLAPIAALFGFAALTHAPSSSARVTSGEAVQLTGRNASRDLAPSVPAQAPTPARIARRIGAVRIARNPYHRKAAWVIRKRSGSRAYAECRA